MFSVFCQVDFAQYDFILMPVCCGISDKDIMKQVPMGSHWILLVADTKHNTVGVIDSMKGAYEKEIQLVLKRWRCVT